MISLGLRAAASATDAATRKKIIGSSKTTLIVSNQQMNDIIKTIKSLEESCLLIKGVSQTIKYEAKEQRGWFLGMLLSTLGVTLLGNLTNFEYTSIIKMNLKLMVFIQEITYIN